ncbi:MAG: peptidylprolyl isomerase [Alphaproteobacteria bacterium]|jgi:cyclophilin family peptidyl-prolyl cis-trans isomerase
MFRYQNIFFALVLAGVLAGVLFSTPAVAKNPVATITTNNGVIRVELFPGRAPKTVANFLAYVKEGHYTNTIFHRVMRGFMIQGGGFDLGFKKIPAPRTVQNEADNGLKNKMGTIAMARLPSPHTASAQFFINTVDNKNLDHWVKTPRGWGYAVFGKVISGMKAVQSIEDTPTMNRGHLQNVPQKPIIIKSITVR